MHYHLWRAYRDWDPDKILDELPEEKNIGTLAYGETPASTVRRALAVCQQHFPNAFSLCDLGAGRGVLSMTAAALEWDVLAVEYMEEFLKRSVPVSEKLGLSVDWVQGDFLKLPLPPADIIHTAATAYPESFRTHMADKFAAEATPEQGLLLQDWILDEERFEVLVGFRLPVTWGSSHFVLHRRKDAL